MASVSGEATGFCPAWCKSPWEMYHLWLRLSWRRWIKEHEGEGTREHGLGTLSLCLSVRTYIAGRMPAPLLSFTQWRPLASHWASHLKGLYTMMKQCSSLTEGISLWPCLSWALVLSPSDWNKTHKLESPTRLAIGGLFGLMHLLTQQYYDTSHFIFCRK